MKGLALTGIGMLAIAAGAPAQAADIRMPVKAYPPAVVFHNWTGFYVGAHGGYGWAEFSDDPSGPGSSASAKGWLGGGQLGFNYQMGSLVLGLEGDYSVANLKFRQDLGGGDFGQIKVNQMATLAGRIGYAFDRTLVYGKVGGAWTREKYDFLIAPDTATGSANRVGWLLGAGVEYAFWSNWSAKVEYNYMNMGTKTVTLATTGALAAAPANVSLDAHAVKVGVNYRFGGR